MGSTLNVGILKKSLLAKINIKPTTKGLQLMRVLRNDSGIPSGLPLKSDAPVSRTLWYTICINPEMSMLVKTTGLDVPSPDASEDSHCSWDDIAAADKTIMMA
eukprot:2501412-Pyramimonas_sp.AAC.2